MSPFAPNGTDRCCDTIMVCMRAAAADGKLDTRARRYSNNILGCEVSLLERFTFAGAKRSTSSVWFTLLLHQKAGAPSPPGTQTGRKKTKMHGEGARRRSMCGHNKHSSRYTLYFRKEIGCTSCSLSEVEGAKNLLLSGFHDFEFLRALSVSDAFLTSSEGSLEAGMSTIEARAATSERIV